MAKAIGVDIGGTKIAIGAVDGAGVIAASRTLPTDAGDGAPGALRRIGAAIDALLSETGWHADDLAGIGIGCPGPVDPDTGLVLNWYTLPGWDGTDVVTPLARRFGKPVTMANDADVALLGEVMAGAAKGAAIAAMLTIGTGIGGATYLNGVLHQGAGGAHPEVGHIPIDPSGPDCYCGTAGCLESLAAGPAIARAGAARGYADARAVFAGAARGEASACAIVERAVAALATGVWTLLHTITPEVIVIGGGLGAAHFSHFAPAAERAAERATLPPPGATRIVRAALGNDAGMVGAAALALRQR